MAKIPTPSSSRRSTMPKPGIPKIAKASQQNPTAQTSKFKSKSQNERKQVMQDTIDQTPAVMKGTPGASTTSTFFNKQLEPLTQNNFPDLKMQPVRFMMGDTFAVTRQVMGSDKDLDGKVAVLNMASDERVWGARGIPSGPTQEDALCYSSTLYETLHAQKDKYPWKNHLANEESYNCAAIFSPSVVIFKHSSENDYADLEAADRKIVGVISVAAPRGVQSIDSAGSDKKKIREGMQKKLDELQGKIRLIYRIAASNGKRVLILGAFGCGKFKCDPETVASMFQKVLMEDEFHGWFEHVVFAIYTQKMLEIFKKAWEERELE